MSIIYRIYDQMAEMIALLEPDKISKFKASTEMQKRFDYLLQKHKNAEIDRKEKDELDHFIVLERLIRLSKIRADKA